MDADGGRADGVQRHEVLARVVRDVGEVRPGGAGPLADQLEAVQGRLSGVPAVGPRPVGAGEQRLDSESVDLALLRLRVPVCDEEGSRRRQGGEHLPDTGVRRDIRDVLAIRDDAGVDQPRVHHAVLGEDGVEHGPAPVAGEDAPQVSEHLRRGSI